MSLSSEKTHASHELSCEQLAIALPSKLSDFALPSPTTLLDLLASPGVALPFARELESQSDLG
jgi:hypothetical protein